MTPEDTPLDLLVIGAGPTGIAVGAAARQAGLSCLLVDRGSLTEAIRNYPIDMEFFTTRERLEIAGVPFAIPDAKPTRLQALSYYREVARKYELPLALREEVVAVERRGEGFAVRSRGRSGERVRRARAVVLATGYFGRPRTLGVPGEELPWVHTRYREACAHYGETVLVVGGGNSAVEAALDLYRWGAEVTLVHRGPGVKPSIKYWLQPDFENRLQEGSIRAVFEARVRRFAEQGVEVETPGGSRWLPAAAAYVLIGYLPELDLAEGCGVRLDPETLVPEHDPESCETNVPGFYVAGTLQAGRVTDRIFIENSRDHGPRIVEHLVGRLRPSGKTPVEVR
jgi:thioredoxin reductase (NADPH)